MYNKKSKLELEKTLQREGLLRSDCSRMIKHDRNIFASAMLSCGDGDILVTGLTRGYRNSLSGVQKIIKNKKDQIIFGMGGYGGNMILIDVENSRILVLNSLHYNNKQFKYNHKKLILDLFKKGKQIN